VDKVAIISSRTIKTRVDAFFVSREEKERKEERESQEKFHN